MPNYPTLRPPRKGPLTLESSFTGRPTSPSGGTQPQSGAPVPDPNPQSHGGSSVSDVIRQIGEAAKDFKPVLAAIKDIIEILAAILAQFATTPSVFQNSLSYPDFARSLFYGLLELVGVTGVDGKTQSPFGLDPPTLEKVLKEGKFSGVSTSLERQSVACAKLMAEALKTVDDVFQIVGTTLTDVTVLGAKELKKKKEKSSKTGKMVDVPASPSDTLARDRAETLFKRLSIKLRSGSQMLTALALAYYFAPDLSYWQTEDKVELLANSVLKGQGLSLASGRSSGPLSYLAGLLPNSSGDGVQVTVTQPGPL